MLRQAANTAFALVRSPALEAALRQRGIAASSRLCEDGNKVDQVVDNVKQRSTDSHNDPTEPVPSAEPQSDTKQADDAKQPEAKDRTKEGYARPDKKDLGTADNLDEAPTEGEAHTKAQSYIHKRS